MNALWTYWTGSDWLMHRPRRQLSVTALAVLTGASALVSWYYVTIAAKFLPELSVAIINDAPEMTHPQLAKAIFVSGLVTLVGTLGLSFSICALALGKELEGRMAPTLMPRLVGYGNVSLLAVWALAVIAGARSLMVAQSMGWEHAGLVNAGHADWMDWAALAGDLSLAAAGMLTGGLLLLTTKELLRRWWSPEPTNAGQTGSH